MELLGQPQPWHSKIAEFRSGVKDVDRESEEPTGNLDSANAKELMALLHHLHQESRVTIIIATHDENIATQTNLRIRLRDGLIVPESPG